MPKEKKLRSRPSMNSSNKSKEERFLEKSVLGDEDNFLSSLTASADLVGPLSLYLNMYHLYC